MTTPPMTMAMSMGTREGGAGAGEGDAQPSRGRRLAKQLSSRVAPGMLAHSGTVPDSQFWFSRKVLQGEGTGRRSERTDDDATRHTLKLRKTQAPRDPQQGHRPGEGTHT